MKDKLLTPYVLTADIGGSHITTAICNIDTNKIIDTSITRVNVSSKDSAENILSGWKKCLEQSMANVNLEISGIGIAMPGPFDYENGISYITGLDKFESIYAMDIKQYLAQTLNFDPEYIKFRNDAEASIAGEVWANFGKKYNNIAGITLGTGFGSAYYTNGVTNDTNWGSLSFKKSIADDYLSTRWFLNRYFELTATKLNEVKELAIMAPDDQTARDVFKEFAGNLESFLMPKLMELQPDALVICGNIAKGANLFLPYLKTKLSIPIELALLGENAALLGVASIFSVANLQL